jgi:DNA repair exonuclease SbcCD ATPase subunit
MSKLTPEQKAILANRGITVDDNGVVNCIASTGPLEARIAALEAESSAAKERAEQAEEQAEEATHALRRDLDEWEADCSRELRSIASSVGFEPEPDGDTVDTIGEYIRLTIEQLRGQVDGYRNDLAAAREREAALAAALDIARQEIEACRQDVAGTYAEARFAGVLAELSDPAPILARVRREAKREAMRGLPGYRFSDTGHDDDKYALWNGYVNQVRAALAALDAEKGEQNG